MRSKLFLSVILVSFLLTSCGQNDPTKSIKVGMTYEEVESSMGKPVSITRGVNQLYYDTENLPYASKEIVTSFDSVSYATKWIIPKNIQKIGNLIYVTWEYEKFKTDTFYVLRNTFKEVKDSKTINTAVYYINDKQVNKTDYDNFDGYEYRLHDNSVVDKGTYDAYKRSGLYKLPAPQKAVRNMTYKTSLSVTGREVKDSVKRDLYKVDYKYCIIFDASSGRVTNSGFYPFEVSGIK